MPLVCVPPNARARLMWRSPWRKSFRRGCSATAATAWCSMSAGWDVCSAIRRRLAARSRIDVAASLMLHGTRITDSHGTQITESHGTRITRIADLVHGTRISRISDFHGTRIPRIADSQGTRVARVAVAPTQIGAMLLSSAHPGLTVVTGDVASALAPVRLEVLRHVLAEMLARPWSPMLIRENPRPVNGSAIREIRVP